MLLRGLMLPPRLALLPGLRLAPCAAVGAGPVTGSSAASGPDAAATSSPVSADGSAGPSEVSSALWGSSVTGSPVSVPSAADAEGPVSAARSGRFDVRTGRRFGRPGCGRGRFGRPFRAARCGLGRAVAPGLSGRLGRPGRGSAAGQGGRCGATPLLRQGRLGELARLVRQVAVGHGNGPLAGHVLAGRGIGLGCGAVGGRGLGEVPLAGGPGPVREPVALPGVHVVRRVRVVRRAPAVRVLLWILGVPLVSGGLLPRVRDLPLRAVHGCGRHRPGAGGRRVGAGGGGGRDRDLRRHIAVPGCGERAVGGGEERVHAALGELHEGGGAVVVVALGQRVPASAARGRAPPC
ncbi:hypothetical protein LV779_04465 [Streptomyces thinghirensis]|nr:hypothetical protein [Streptomyces thinghirensis]